MLNKIKKYTPIFVFICAFLSRIILIDSHKVLNWDTAVYLMNAKWFAGQHIYFEALRAPLWPFFLSFFYRIGITNEHFYIGLSLLISSLTICAIYYIGKKFFGERVGLICAAIYAVLPVSIFWSAFAYVEIPASLLALISIYFALKEEEKYIYISFFFSAFAFLTRNTMFILPISLLIFFIINKKLNLKNFVIISLIFAITISPWLIYNQIMFGDPIYYAKEQLRWSGNPSPIFYYIEQIPQTFSFTALLIIPCFFYCLKDWKKKEVQALLIFVLSFLLFLTLVPHKESRYLLQFIPALVLLSCYIFKEKFNKKIALLVILIIIISAINSYSFTFQTMSYLSKCDGIIKISSNLSGTVASTFWPQTAYYGNVQSYALTADQSNLKKWLKELNISYIITSDTAEYPEYAKNISFFDSQNYLTKQKQISDACGNYTLYKVVS